VKYIIADISNKNFINKKIKENFQYVVNLAGYVDHSNEIKTYKSHYLGCKNSKHLNSFFIGINCLITFPIDMKISLHYFE
jgi:hypothetical protein